MPGLDRRGPMGNGSMTGNGKGFCNSEMSDTFRNNSWRRKGLWAYDDICMGMGRRHGRKKSVLQANSLNEQTEKTEIKKLKNQANKAKEILDCINRKIDAIEKNFWQIH